MPLSTPNLLHITTASLRGNPVRSLLTMVGVFMGVLAVNGTLQAQNISQQIIQRQLASQEAPQLRGWLGGMTEADKQWLSEQLGNVSVSSGMSGDWGQVSYGANSTELGILFVSPEYLETTGLQMRQGRFFNTIDLREFRAVGIIDQTTAEQLFPETSPLGKELLFKDSSYTIVGVVEARPVERDDQIYGKMLLPLSRYQAQIGRRQMDAFSLRAADWQQMAQQEEQLKALLQERFPDNPDPWVWQNATAIAEQQEILTLVSRGLLGLGLVALVISGVGIANITFASVLERTPEIGLRRAIGATPRDILCQFLLEAVVISAVGGIAAIAVVEGTTRLVVTQFDLPYEFQLSTVSLSLVAAIVVGAGSSFVPAQRASRIEPMSALRNE